MPNDSVDHGGHLHLRKHRHVVRTIRDHDHVIVSRLRAIQLGLFPSDRRRHHDADWKFRFVHDLVPVVLSIPAGDCDGRSQKYHASW